MSILRHSVAALAASLGLPVGLAALAFRPGWRDGWRERLGFTLPVEPNSIWLHAASAGEAQLSLALEAELRVSGERSYGSTSTASGREILRRGRPDLPSSFAPLDHPWCVANAMNRVCPRALVLVETELWPSWIAAAERRSIPVMVLSAQISERSFERYSKLQSPVRRTMGRLSAVGARSESDARRFVDLGTPQARVEVTGDLKSARPRSRVELAEDLEKALSQVDCFVAGSTHPSEESAALQALDHCEARGESFALVLAPRRPERAAEVAQLVRVAGRKVSMRSELDGSPVAAGEVLVVDGLGELAAIYTRARVSFVGGSLVPVGGHNLYEPVRAGSVVIFGPHVDEVHEAAGRLVASGWGRRVAAASELGEVVLEVLRGRLDESIPARLDTVDSLDGVTGDARDPLARSLDLLLRTLDAAGGGGDRHSGARVAPGGSP